MKVQCPKCNTTYRIADDRVPSGGGTVKVRCKNCGNVIGVQRAGSGETPGPVERWFVAIGNDKQGPLEREQVIAMIRSGEIGGETYVWRKGFREWMRLGDVEELAAGGSGARSAGAAGRTSGAALASDGPSSAAEMEPTVMEPLPTAAFEARNIPAAVVGESGPGPSGTAEGSGPQPAPDSGTFPAATPPASGPSSSEEDSETRMIWQRRETSVLFSLDDYKTRRKTRSGKAVTAPAPVVQVQPVPPAREEAPAPRGTERVKVISLEEAEVKRVAEALNRRQRRRVLLRNSLVAVAGVVVVAVAAYVVTTHIGREEPVPVQEQVVKPSPPAPTAPAVVPEPPGQAVMTPPAPAPVAEETVPKAPEVPEARKNEQQPANKTSGKGKPARVEAPPAPAPRPAEERPQPPSRPATDDVNALLANLRSGQGGGAPTGERTDSKPGAESSEALPEQLTTGQIQSVLRKQQKAVEECVRKSGVAPGTTVTVNTRVEIEGSGRVSSASVSSAGAAEGCIRSVLTGLRFPRFKGANMAVPYPFRVSL